METQIGLFAVDHQVSKQLATRLCWEIIGVVLSVGRSIGLYGFHSPSPSRGYTELLSMCGAICGRLGGGIFMSGHLRQAGTMCRGLEYRCVTDMRSV